MQQAIQLYLCEFLLPSEQVMQLVGITGGKAYVLEKVMMPAHRSVVS